ncbi:thiamine pyrophosphate-binding protein [Pantoea sp. Tr-811]|uniref:thiamine pyrophosphate-binding protein n=1 Tax=Pantoea sp. Tr-811 TaxID=2608361 RepID=UPI0014214C41|nr:thiamine pyrophosphate-binding protein [Pantoea sp. Tr-811]NIF30300.1 thiamine pyrophosphate-binding protein [Pantoea sp. Tr-811]
MSDAQSRNGGKILVEALIRNAVDTIYCVPGESYLPVLDALHDTSEIRTIVTRHEGAASNMADAYGKLTGRPGICFVTRGPGATHASNGVHTAKQDSTPMILFIGQIESRMKEREAFQEIDYRQMFGGVAKWATEIESIDRIPEIVSRAFNIAMSGRPGPVVIGLPEDVLFGEAVVADIDAVRVPSITPAPESIIEVKELLSRSSRPLVVVGGTGWDDESVKALNQFATVNNLPVAASFRRQDLFDNRDPHYVGQLGLGSSPALLKRVAEADLLLVIGSRMSETVSQSYELISSPAPSQKLIHVHPDASELNRVFKADLPVLSTLRSFARDIAKQSPIAQRGWDEWTRSARADYEAHSTPPAAHPELNGVDLGSVMAYLNETLPDDAILTNGAGNYTVWLHRFYRYRSPATELAPTNGAMGYGLPAAVAAKLHAPDKTVVCFAGDGCFMMYPQELATAVQFGAPLITIVVNNSMFGTIRMHQEKTYPNRVSATRLVNPDFVTFAKSFGANAERVVNTEDFPAAFERALKSDVPSLIELITDPRQSTPQLRFEEA